MKIQEERNKVDNWLKVIADYLMTRDDIKDSLDKENKSLEECGQYILQEAQKKGSRVAMTDEEVFSLAVHYYDEDDLKIEKSYHARAYHERLKKSKDTVASKPAQEEKPIEKVDIEEIVEKRVQERLAEINKAEKAKKEKRTKKKAKKIDVKQVSLFDL